MIGEVGGRSVDEERDGVTWRNSRCGNQGIERWSVMEPWEKHLGTPFLLFFFFLFVVKAT